MKQVSLRVGRALGVSALGLALAPGLLLAAPPAPGPGTAAGPSQLSSRPASGPTTPNYYWLKGDSANIGSATTVFSTTNAGNGGGWVFHDETPTGYPMAVVANCAKAAGCIGVEVQGVAYGVQAAASGSTGTGVDAISGTGVRGTSSNPNGTGVVGIGGSTSGTGVSGSGGSYGGMFTGTASDSMGVSATATYVGLRGFATASNSIGVSGQGSAVGVTGGATNPTGVGVSGLAPAVGVTGLANAAQGIGVKGKADVIGGVGVLGQTGGGYAGVRGFTTGGAASYGGVFTATSGVGVAGASDAGYGVQGTAPNGTGVYGSSTNSFGIYGISNMSYGVYGTSANNTGVYGNSTNSYGLYGQSNSGIGVYGGSTSNYGVLAETANGTVALSAVVGTKGPGYYAIWADGNVYIKGNYMATGTKSARVATTQGDRLMYAEEATTNIFSDRGTAQLTGGRAVIAIDPLYAQTVSLTAGYQVFVTPWSAETAGLAVVQRTATSFEVRELGKGAGSFRFDWRIEAPRKGYEKVRMAAAPPVPADPIHPGK